MSLKWGAAANGQGLQTRKGHQPRRREEKYGHTIKAPQQKDHPACVNKEQRNTLSSQKGYRLEIRISIERGGMRMGEIVSGDKSTSRVNSY